MDVPSKIRLHPLPVHGLCNQRLAQTDPPMFRVSFTLIDLYLAPLLTFTDYRNTKPGGYVECIDLDIEVTSPDGTFTPDRAFYKFNREFLKISKATGMEPCPGPLLEGWMKETGFLDVTAHKFVWPVGTWPADKHLVMPQP